MANRERSVSYTEGDLKQIVTEEGSPIIELLEDCSFSRHGWEENKSTFGPAVDLSMISGSASRKVTIGLFSGRRKPVATVMIVRLPRERVADDLFVELLAKEHLPDLDPTQFQIDPKKALRTEAARVFKLYAEILAGPALPIVKGEHWEEGHFYDWTLHG